MTKLKSGSYTEREDAYDTVTFLGSHVRTQSLIMQLRDDCLHT